MVKWMLRQAAVNVGELAVQWNIHPVLAHVLAVRGFREPQEVFSFLYAADMELPSAAIFADMLKAVDLVSEAIIKKQRIAIFGDYDADGVSSTVILYKTLAALNADVLYYIPQRDNEGYGLNNEAILSLKQQQVEMIIACDNGVSAFEQVEYANSLELTVIILDHHDLPLDATGEQVLVAAAAVVDAKRQDCAYPFKLFCAAGLCYRFSAALFERFNMDWHNLGQELLAFAALATICDLVELLGENRCLAQRGLPAITESTNPGLQALIAALGLSGQKITAYHVGFRLGPCVNASGRLKDAALAVELFLCKDKTQAAEMAHYLTELNETRKTLTEQGAALALEAIESQGFHKDKIIVAHCHNIHESVAGIIAGKLKEHYYKPVIIITGDKEILRGSGRSIEPYHMYQGLCSCGELFINFGGHPMAAGFSIPQTNVGLLREHLNRACTLSQEDMQPIRRIDKILPLSEATLVLARELQAFEPFGKGNHIVYFADRGVKLLKIAILGATGHVLRLSLQSQHMKGSVEAICFEGKEKLQELLKAAFGDNCWPKLVKGNQDGVLLDILYTLNVNTYQGRESAQPQLIDFRLAQGE
ncbi:MAG: single-stranded-DNA-specific exonuclease RecJ [Clostridiales bacterium]|nr:single-stranded-DNA-specific exonuclease RecJ [Clostridiales bacterium]